MPKSFQDKHPNEMHNLRLNSRKLTTPFDINETLKHFLKFKTTQFQSKKKNKQRSYSLLTPIPIDRSCADAEIEAHWCSCLDWISLNITTNDIFLNKILEKQQNPMKSMINNLDKSFTQDSLRIANKAVDFINSLIVPVQDDCERIHLKSIESLAILNLNEKMLAFKESQDLHGRVPVFEFTNNSLLDQQYSLKTFNNSFINHNNNKSEYNYANTKITFQIILTCYPGKLNEIMKYEMTFKYFKFNDKFEFAKNEISRINNYNNSSYCILNKRPDLRSYCVCK